MPTYAYRRHRKADPCATLIPAEYIWDVVPPTSSLHARSVEAEPQLSLRQSGETMRRRARRPVMFRSKPFHKREKVLQRRENVAAQPQDMGNLLRSL